MKYGHMRGETRDVAEEGKVTEQEEIWAGCVKWATFLTAAVPAVVQAVCDGHRSLLLLWNSERICWECVAVPCECTEIQVLSAHTRALWNLLEIHICSCSAAGFCQQ